MILWCFTALVKFHKTSLKLYQNFRPTSIKPLLTSSLSLLGGTSVHKIYLQIGCWLMVKYPGSSALSVVSVKSLHWIYITNFSQSAKKSLIIATHVQLRSVRKIMCKFVVSRKGEFFMFVILTLRLLQEVVLLNLKLFCSCAIWPKVFVNSANGIISDIQNTGDDLTSVT